MKLQGKKQQQKKAVERNYKKRHKTINKMTISTLNNKFKYKQTKLSNQMIENEWMNKNKNIQLYAAYKKLTWDIRTQRE